MDLPGVTQQMVCTGSRGQGGCLAEQRARTGLGDPNFPGQAEEGEPTQEMKKGHPEEARGDQERERSGSQGRDVV